MKQKKISNVNNSEAAEAILMKPLEKLFNAPAYTNPQEAYMENMAALNAIQEETPVTGEQWKKLYEVTENIKKLAPWEALHESQRITILLPGRDEPVYIVVMGNGGITYGIGIYPGYDSLRRLHKMIEGESDKLNISAALEQHCINLYFCDREELEPKDKKVIKELGLKFRGKKQWPYFRSMKPGFMPWHINQDEAELTIAALQNFVMAFLSYATDGLEVDFENGETLLRFYDSDSDTWYNTNVEMPPTPSVTPKLVIRDDLLCARLKRKKKNHAKLSFTLTYLPMPIQENKNYRPILPRIAILSDEVNGLIIDKAIETGYEAIGEAIAEMIINYVTEHGRPISIAVSGEDTRNYIEDFAAKLNIKLVEDETLGSITNQLISMMAMMEPDYL